LREVKRYGDLFALFGGEKVGGRISGGFDFRTQSANVDKIVAAWQKVLLALKVSASRE